LQGKLIFSDFEKRNTYAMQFNPANPSQNVIYRIDLQGLGNFFNIAAFGHDHDNNMYILNWFSAGIMRLKQETVAPPTTIPPVSFPTEPIAESPTDGTPISEPDPNVPSISSVPSTSTPEVDREQVNLGSRGAFDPRVLGLAIASALFYFA
jgi:hypothetical protein